MVPCRTFYQFSIKCTFFSRLPNRRTLFCNRILCKSFNEKDGLNKIVPVRPVLVKPVKDDPKVGMELTGKLESSKVEVALKAFFDRPEVLKLAGENGITDYMFLHSKTSFKNFCAEVNDLPADLHIILNDVISGASNCLDLFPYFLKHAKLVYPHTQFLNELSKIGDLTDPIQWFPFARTLNRKIIFHYGPTNSGKTHMALNKFFEVERGIYCAPLKMLAHEIYEKSKIKRVECDLITGEEVKRAISEEKPANHTSCTMEMTSTDEFYDVAVIDEIQMLRDPQRGHAWTKAFLGVAAKEVHLCGEESALEYIQVMTEKLGETLEVKKYNRLTKLYLENNPVDSFENIKPGDCIICFNRKHLFFVANAIEQIGIKYCVIYGSLPPKTKIEQAKLFNDPDNDFNVLLATDAVGLGVNLNIRRIVFYSLKKFEDSAQGTKHATLSVSLALQIAGRAGRYKSKYNEGFVTTFRKADLEELKQLLQGSPEPLLKAGLSPSLEQIEMFSYYLPKYSLSQIIDIFVLISKIDPLYFLCDLAPFKRLADKIQSMPISVKDMYVFCCAPVNSRSNMCMIFFTQFASLFSRNQAITKNFLKAALDWPPKTPVNSNSLATAEDIFDILELYRWLGRKYPLSFPDNEAVAEMQNELDRIIQEGISNILQKSNKGIPTAYNHLFRKNMVKFYRAKVATKNSSKTDQK